MSFLVLLRHGQSEWNLQARFTGRTDVSLTDKGREEAMHAGVLLFQEGIKFDIAHTSTLKRAYETADIVLAHARQKDIIPFIFQELCERDYGSLTGCFHAAAAQEFGEEQVMKWRRSFDVRPPDGESVKDVMDNRVKPYHDRCLAPLISAGKNILVVAHNNSLRPEMIILGQETPETITKADLKTGVPIVYEFKGGIITNRFTLE